MSMDYQRKMLAELMAPLLPDTQKKFTDRNVCKNHLVEFCPNEQFTNTKADLGSCSLIHEKKLHDAYQASPDKGSFGWEKDFYDRLSRLMNDIDRQIKRGRERINTKGPGEMADARDEQQERIVMIERKIQELLEKVEIAGDDGKVEEAKALMIEAEKHKIEMELVRKGEDSLSLADRRMEVCPVCGALLIVNDCQQRLDAHDAGKQHQGYKLVRETYEIWKNDPSLYKFENKNPPHREERRVDDHRESRRSRSPPRRPYERDSRDSRDSRNNRDSRTSRDSRDRRSPNRR